MADLQPLRLQLIEDLAGRRLFQQYMQRYHPLGYRVPYGAQLRYLVRTPSQDVLACLLFTSAAWKMAPRDTWIGWSDPARRANLSRVVNNGRFLILPWVEVPHLASHVLALAARQLPTDWLAAYGVRPLLLETLVDRPYTGTCYRAANWICVGQTQGRGRMDRAHQAQGSHKDILLYPLESHWRQHAYASFRHLRFAMLLLEKFHELLRPWRSAFAQPRTWQRAQRLAYGLLLCLRTHLTSNAICATGRQFLDWSADYRLFSRSRVGSARLVRSHLRSPAGAAAFAAGSGGSRPGRYAV